MKPLVIGNFRSVNELENISFTYKRDLREKVKFLVIDDEPFVYLEKLRSAKFNVTQIRDISDLHAISEYQVIICDINGVGNAFSTKYGGAFVLNQMKQLYPEKQYAYYSGNPAYTKEIIKLLNNITSISKDAEIDQWTAYFDKFLENYANPKFAWNQIRDLCIAHNISSFSIALLEDEYVRKIEKAPSSLNTINLDEYKIKDELQNLIKAIFANLIASLVISAL